VITVNDLPTAATSAVYLAIGENTNVVTNDDNLTLEFSTQPISEYDTVAKVSLEESVSEGDDSEPATAAVTHDVPSKK